MPFPFRPRLRFGTDISPFPLPMKAATPSSPHILIIGAGVTGLTTAWLLLDRGYHVTIISAAYPTFTSSQRLTSQIAGALWELPPGGCGPQATADDLNTAREFALESYLVYRSILSYPGLAAAFGIQMRTLAILAGSPLEDDPAKFEKMTTIERSGVIEGFARLGEEWVKDHAIDDEFNGGVVDGYEHLAPVVDSDRAMEWLMQLVRTKGAKMVTAKISGDLLKKEADLKQHYGADAIVNATGLGARELASDDEVFPVRGAVLRIINDGKDFPKIEKAMIWSTDSDECGKFLDVVFLVPRNDNIMILGSIVQKWQTDLDLTVDSPVVKDMFERLKRFLPATRNARLDPEYPLAQGLRPFRETNLRVERDGRRCGRARSSIVHCYGHGGAGWSLAFGSAAEAACLIEDVVGAKATTSKDPLFTGARL